MIFISFIDIKNDIDLGRNKKLKRKNFFLKKINFIILFFILYFLQINLICVKAINNSENLQVSELTKTYSQKYNHKIINNDNLDSKLKFKDVSVVFKDLKEKNKLIISDIIFNTQNEEIEILKKEYKKDLNAKHPIIGWKHDLGSLFSKQIRLFYNIHENAKTVPCSSFQEILNFKQIILNLLEHHIPKIEILFDFLDIAGLKEEFIDNKYDRIGLESVSFYSLLQKNPELGCFYFQDEDRHKIHSVDISFCNCKTSGYSIVDLIFEIINFKSEDLIIFKQHLTNYINHLKQMDKEGTSQKDIDNLIEEFLANVIEITDIEILDKNFLLHLMRKFISIFIPKFFSLHHSIDYKNIKPLKEMKLEISSKKEHQTTGFLLQIEKNNEDVFYLCFYEIFLDEQKIEEKLKLIDKILILDSKTQEYLFFNHLSIDIKQNKKLFMTKTKLFGLKKK